MKPAWLISKKAVRYACLSAVLSALLLYTGCASFVRIEDNDLKRAAATALPADRPAYLFLDLSASRAALEQILYSMDDGFGKFTELLDKFDSLYAATGVEPESAEWTIIGTGGYPVGTYTFALDIDRGWKRVQGIERRWISAGGDMEVALPGPQVAVAGTKDTDLVAARLGATGDRGYAAGNGFFTALLEEPHPGVVAYLLELGGLLPFEVPAGMFGESTLLVLGNFSNVIEIKGYNNRYLDIYINLPQSLASLEPRFRGYLAARVRRGKVELNLKYRRLQNDLSFSIDREAIVNFTEVLHAIADAAKIKAEVTLSNLLTMEGLVKSTREIDPDETWEAIFPLLEQTFEEFSLTRHREGEGTEKSILSHLEAFTDAVDVFHDRSAELEENIIRNIQSRFETILGGRVDEDRVLAETAVLLVKFSIDEELSRLDGHLKAFRSTMEQEEPVGKKLDFLCQELNREINTIGSKSTIYEINSSVVNAKDALEKIREQLRNVE